MTILALDCSSDRRSAALCREGIVLAHVVLEQAARAFSSVTLAHHVLSAASISPSDVTCVAVGLGPGSYTGIRSSIAVAQAFQLAIGSRAQGFNSFDAIARVAQGEQLYGEIQIAINAQRQEVYTATYQIERNHLTCTDAITLAPMEMLRNSARRVIGPDISRWLPNATDIYADALAIAALCSENPNPAPAETLEPIYLRAVDFVKAPLPRWP